MHPTNITTKATGFAETTQNPEATVLLRTNAGVAWLTLNRPANLNSFNAQMHTEMRNLLQQIRKDSSLRVLVITGAGRGFCAGQDLGDRTVAPGAEAPDLGASIEKNYNPLIRNLSDFPIPVIAAVNGVAAGAGANLALACDLVFAARSASFVQAFCRIGLVPDSGGTWKLPRLVGEARARGLALLGDKLSAQQAADWGMIWQCVADDQLLAAVTQLAEHLATQPTQGLALIKRALNASANNSLEQQLDLERDLQRLAGRTDDYREGVTAFIEKRPARFKGC